MILPTNGAFHLPQKLEWLRMTSHWDCRCQVTDEQSKMDSSTVVISIISQAAHANMHYVKVDFKSIKARKCGSKKKTV